jgi:hypothetical protein
MTKMVIGGYLWKVPDNFGEVSREQMKAIAADQTPRNVVAVLLPLLPVKVLNDEVVLTLFTICQFVFDEPPSTPFTVTPPDDWTWQQLEEVRELIAGQSYPWLFAPEVCALFDYTGNDWFGFGCSAIAAAIEFLNRFELVFEGQLTQEEKDAGADALLQFKYYGAANRLAQEWHMTPTRVLQEKAGDCYLKMLYDITQQKINDNLRENSK